MDSALVMVKAAQPDESIDQTMVLLVNNQAHGHTLS
jgi:hypothetical protein